MNLGHGSGILSSLLKDLKKNHYAMLLHWSEFIQNNYQSIKI